MITFDLDPGEGVKFADVVAGARRIREVLASVDLVSFVKTSGGKGLHVVAPLTRRAGWDEVKGFAGAVAMLLAGQEPRRYLATMSKARRKGRIFVDYLRNGRGATSVAPWSTRARDSAPVSMPVDWKELDDLRGAADFTVENATQRLRQRDPWTDFARARQQLSASRLRTIQQMK
jgi:bifunctional non-homologous end joining protein LigD